jgi:hypothetical protein
MILAALLAGFAPAAASAQQNQPQLNTLSDVLSFLLTNRAVKTDDFERDAAAAEATRATVSNLLLAELATQPPSLSSVGFTYRFNPAIGTVERASASFGSFFTERSLTAGRGQSALGVSFRTASYQTLDGRDLRDGTFRTTANQFRDEAQPFDDEKLTLRLDSRVLTFTGTFGITDRLDLSAAVPVVSLSMTGSRVNTYRGTQQVQASAEATTSGVGDVAVRAKYALLAAPGGGIAVAGELRLPTGRTEDLIGTGKTALSALVIGSAERGQVGVHGNVSVAGGGLSSEVAYRGALTVAATDRLTLVGELIGRRIADAGRITEARMPHPTIAGVDTIRLISEDTSLASAAAVFGAKWNVARTWIVSAHVEVPITDGGLRSGPITLVGLDYAFGQ